MTDTILSFYDYTGEALKPWAEAGYKCLAFDIQHDGMRSPDVYPSGGTIHYMMADLHDSRTWESLLNKYRDTESVALVMGWPVCTDLAVSGAAHWAKKAEANSEFQEEAVKHALDIALFATAIDAPYMIENPVGRLATMWRKPCFYFHPYEFGGWIPTGEEVHPRYPNYIAPRDAYPKKTGLWTGNGFVAPTKSPVECPEGYSTQHLKLGGKSTKTKNIRSATPRGFARAVFEANGHRFIKEVKAVNV
jgi:hypothetical protein